MDADARSRFIAAIAALQSAVPQLDLALADPATNAQLDAAEATIGFALPPELRALYGVHNGQAALAHGLIGGLPLLSVEQAVAEWTAWRHVAAAAFDSDYSSVPASAVVETYTHVGWFPFAHDGGGNFLAVDTAPGPAGTVGQVISFGRDEHELFAYAPSVVLFFERIVALAAAGRAKVSDDESYAGWGIDDAEGGWPRYADFADEPITATRALNDEEWFESLDETWRQFVLLTGTAADFSKRTKLYSTRNSKAPLRVESLDPLSRSSGLREIILYTMDLGSLRELPELPDLRELRVYSRSNEGIERFGSLRLLSSTVPDGVEPAADFFSPLTKAPLLVTLFVGEGNYDLAPLADCAKLKEITLRLHSASQFADLARVTGLTKLYLDATSIPQLIDELDWGAVPKLSQLTISGGRIASFDFIAQLPRLTVLTADGFQPAAERVDVSAVAALPKIAEVQLSPIAYSGVEAFRNTTTLREFSGGFEAFDVLKDLRPDLPFMSMRGEMTDEQHAVWMAHVRSSRTAR